VKEVDASVLWIAAATGASRLFDLPRHCLTMALAR
jgi:hypothetical protein